MESEIAVKKQLPVEMEKLNNEKRVKPAPKMWDSVAPSVAMELLKALKRVQTVLKTLQTVWKKPVEMEKLKNLNNAIMET